MTFDPHAKLIQLPRRVKDPATGQWVTRLDEYLEVKWRLVWFREKCPHGTLTTETLLLDWDQGVAVIKATVTDGEGGSATGTGTETRKGFEDFVERSETRAIGRALAALGFGTQFTGEELSEGEHIVDAPVGSPNGQGDDIPSPPEAPGNGQPAGGTMQRTAHPAEAITSSPDHPAELAFAPEATRLTPDQARELKKLAQTAFGYAEGERRLRHDLGFEPDERLTLRHLAAHVTTEQYQALMDTYTAILRQQVDADVP
jgi:hypothetical protein